MRTKVKTEGCCFTVAHLETFNTLSELQKAHQEIDKETLKAVWNEFKNTQPKVAKPKRSNDSK